MKFKLANGHVIASTKQPLQNKNFDRMELCIGHEDYEPFDQYGEAPKSEAVEFEMIIHNPSTHLIRKSWSANPPKLVVGVYPRGNVGCRFSDCCPWVGGRGGAGNTTWASVRKLFPGDSVDISTYPRILGDVISTWTQTVNPFNNCWLKHNPTSQNPVTNFIKNTYPVTYAMVLYYRTGGAAYGHQGYTKHVFDYTLDWKVH